MHLFSFYFNAQGITGFRQTNYEPGHTLHKAWYSSNAILMDSASLWRFATRHSVQLNGQVLSKSCNAVAECYSDAQRVYLSALMAVFYLFVKDLTICSEVRLPMSADRPTDAVKTTLLEY